MCIKEGTLQAYLDGELGPSDRESVAAHLHACRRCHTRAAAAAVRHARVADCLSGAVVAADGEATTTALARFHERAVATSARRAYAGGSSRAPGFAVLVRAGVAAAVLGIAAMAFFLSGHGTGQPTPRGWAPGNETATPPTQAANSPVAAGPAVESPAVQGPTQPAASSPRSQRTRRRADADPYFLVTTDASPPEMGIVVRVSMPLSLLTMGVEAPPAVATEPRVEADVLVGEDGRARAIRFVNQTLTPGGK